MLAVLLLDNVVTELEKIACKHLTPVAVDLQKLFSFPRYKKSFIFENRKPPKTPTPTQFVCDFSIWKKRFLKSKV